MAEDFFGDITAEPKNDFFGDIKPAEPERRGVVERVTRGWKGGFGEEPLGLSPENRAKFPMVAPFQPLIAGADAAWRAIPGVLGAGAGAVAAGTEYPVTGYPAASKAEADRLQRDLGIVGQGLMVEPGMGLAAAHPAAQAQAVARAGRRSPERPVTPVSERPVEPAPVPEPVPRPAEEPAPAAPVEAPPEPTGPETARSPGEPRDLFDDLIRGVEEAQDVLPEAAKPAVDSRAPAPLEGEVIAPGRKGEFDQVPWTAEDGNPWGMSDADYAVWREQPENRATVEEWERDNKIIQGEGAKPAPKAIDYFADITEEPPARTTERIPDEAATAGERPAEAAQAPVDSRKPQAEIREEDGRFNLYINGRFELGASSRKYLENQIKRGAYRDVELTPPEAVSPAVDSRPTKAVKEKPPETLSSYIARNGGLELTAEARDMGLHKRFIPGAGNVARKNGRSLDKFWRERLAEAGYIDRDPDGGIQRDIRGELYEKLGGSEPAYSKFDRAPELKVDPRSADIERQARIIEDAFEKEGLSKTDIDTEALYEAADLLYRGEAKDPFEAYDRAATRLGDREDAQPRGMRGEGTEIYPPSSEGAGPRIEKAVTGTGEGMQGPGSAGRVSGKEVRKSQAMSRVYEPGAEGKPQLVLPGAERLTAAELAKRKVAESLAARQKQEKLTGKVPQKPMDEGLFGEGFKQEDLFAQAAKKPDQSLIQRQEIERGRSGRPTKTKPIPIGTEEAILERGYEKTTGPKGEPREPGIEPLIREAGEEAISLKLAQRNRPKLAAITGFFGGKKINPTEARVKMQDKFLRIKRMQDQWRRDNPGRDLPESMNVYQAESLSYGKIDKRIRQADKDHVDPLIQEIKGNGLTYKEAGDYITAKHVPERNRELRKINPSIPDPAGMSDAQAASILAAARPRQGNFDAVYNRFRRMVDETLNSQVRDGLITPQQAAAWRQRWPDYAPMRHTEVGEGWMSPGKGLEVKGKESKQALGRLSQADNPIAYGIEQMQRAIIRGEHNTVGRALGEFVSQTPEPGLWEFNKGPKIRYLDPKTNTVREMTDPLWRARDDVFTYKENGKEQSIWFTDPVYGRNLARAMKNLGTSEMNSFMRVVSAGTRTMARLSTSWSPEFMLSNFFRDAGETMMILPAEQKKGLARKFIKHLFPSIQGALRGQGSGTGFYAQKFREFENAGGRIGFLGMEGAESITANVARKLRRLEGGPINTLRDWGQRAVDAIDVANNSIENGTRLSMFISAQELGLSTAKAASIAREATVNFNRKGEMGSYISGLYMFANAGVQGQARMIQALKSHKVKAGAGALAGGGAVLAIYNIVAGGRDEDGSSKYSKLPAWTREANVILMHPDGSGRYFSIPVPFGFGMFKSIGDHTAAAVYGDEPAAKALNAMLWASIESFDPLGRDQNPVAHFTPTLLRPIPHIVMNQNAFGRPVNPDPMPWNKYGPDSERAFRTASPFSTALAQKLNTMTGGDKKTPGAVDVGPGTVDYMLQFIGGGLGRFVFNTATAGTRVYQGREWVPEKTPIVRRFYGEKSDQADRALYFEEREKVRAADQRKQTGAERAAAGLFKTVDQNRTKLLKQIDRVNGNESLTAAQKDEQVKTLQKQELKLMFTARRALERSRARAEQREPKFAEGGSVFDPEGSDYDYETATKGGLKPDETGHWSSRDPSTGQILKGRQHPTFSLTEEGEAKAGYEIKKGENGRYYSFPRYAAGGIVTNGMNHTPTAAQIEAGNYAKGQARIHGLDISIENRKGGTRRGVGKDGPWEVKMPAHYGYIKGTTGADKEHMDCYLGPHLGSRKVFVVNQCDADSKKFDEHKCMLGFGSKAQAIATYRKGFSDGRGGDRIDSVKEMSIEAFKDWLDDGETSRKFAGGGEVSDEQRNARAVFARDKAAADAMLPAPGRALEDRLNKGAWENRFGRYGTAPESENIEDRRAFGFRRTGRFIGGFKRGGTPTPYVERKPRTVDEFIEKHGREPMTDAEMEQFGPHHDEPIDFNPEASEDIG